MLFKHISLGLVTGLAISFCFLSAASAAAVVPAPTILSVKMPAETHLAHHVVVGLTVSGTEVAIYADSKKIGEAVVKSARTGTDSFAFTLDKPLMAGKHVVMAVARDKKTQVVSESSRPFEIYLSDPDAPTLVGPNERSVIGTAKPLITGLVQTNSRVHVWIDGVYNGKTPVLNHRSGTANFAYRPFLNLAAGTHTVKARTEDEGGRMSGDSKELSFKVEAPLPAPTLFKPVVKDQAAVNRPLLAGVTKNNTSVKVYIDKKLNGQFKVDNNPSGTANFTYTPFLPLTPGSHLIYTEAVDARGKVSPWSNLVSYHVPVTTEPKISAEAVEEKVAVEPEKEEPAVPKPPESGEEEPVEVRGAEKEVGIPVSEAERQEIEDFIAKVSTTAPLASGLVDESESEQGRLQLNLIIFIAFLLAVIAWIIWVNRELIKERRNLAKIEDKANKNEKLFE